MTDLVPYTDTLTLDDAQRAAIRDYFEQHPDGGYKRALRAAGVRASKTQARQIVEADPDLSEARERSLGVDEDSAWRRVAKIAENLDHKDALRANTFILAAIHGRTDQTGRLEVTGPGGGPVELQHERRLTLADVAALASQLNGSREGAGGELPAARPILAEAGGGEPAAGRVLPRG